MQKENYSLGSDFKQHVLELMHKLDVGNAKLEQCAFDSINATDQIMMALTNVMMIVEETTNQQAELMSVIDMVTLSMSDEEGENLLHHAKSQSDLYLKLETELHKAIAAAMEANDSAHCIETCIAEQSERVNDLLQYNEQMIDNI